MALEALFDSLPAKWEYISLGDACARGGGNIQTGPFGSQLHSHDYVPVGIPSIMPQNIGENRINEEGIFRIKPEDANRLNRYLVKPGDIVYSRRGDVEKRSLIREPENGWLCGTGCLRVRFGPKGINPLYASFYLSHPAVRGWIVRHAHGATMPNLNTSILSSLPFVVPPTAEQERIAHILGTLDDKIELNRRMNETLEAMAQAIFKKMFPYSPEDELPKGWMVDSFAATIEILGGGTPKTSVAEYWDGEIPWFSVVDSPKGSDLFVIDTEKKISQAGIDNSSTAILPEGVTIITARGTVGNVALVGKPMAMNQSCYGLRGRFAKHGYFTYFVTAQMVDVLKQRGHGSVFNTITRDTLESVRVVVPPAHVIEAFEDAVLPTLGRIKNNLCESRTLADLRDALLPKLLSGDVRVDAAKLHGGRP